MFKNIFFYSLTSVKKINLLIQNKWKCKQKGQIVTYPGNINFKFIAKQLDREVLNLILPPPPLTALEIESNAVLRLTAILEGNEQWIDPFCSLPTVHVSKSCYWSSQPGCYRMIPWFCLTLSLRRALKVRRRSWASSMCLVATVEPQTQGCARASSACSRELTSSCNSWLQIS